MLSKKMTFLEWAHELKVMENRKSKKEIIEKSAKKED